MSAVRSSADAIVQIVHRGRDGMGCRRGVRRRVAGAAIGAIGLGVAHGFIAKATTIDFMSPPRAPGAGQQASAQGSARPSPTASAPAFAEAAAEAASGGPARIGLVSASAVAAFLAATRARQAKNRRSRQLVLGRRAQSNGGIGGFFKFIKDAFVQKSDQDDRVGQPTAAASSLDVASKCIVISSRSPIGQPFCGSYAEQPFQLNDRGVYKKVGIPSGGQDVYLLYNSAQQWVFTPHSDGRADGWAFVLDPAATPSEITGVFKVWNGTAWSPDATLGAKKTAAEKAAAVANASAPLDGAAGAPQNEDTAQHVSDGVVAHNPLSGSVQLPEDAKSLAMLHFRSHWEASRRCLYKLPEPVEELVNRKLPEHPGVQRGILKNGMRYVVFENAMPPQRFEAHIELHVGSIDEESHEQGIAHMMEHVCFLGSRKRERLIGTGSRSNALTDFQHTIYHIHSPVKLEDGRDMYMPALEALHEIAFAPEMLPYRIEKERKAVLAEMQQVNDMEYRIETWTLSGLHETNNLGTQFPIGKEEQIKAWQQKDLKAFHEKWYYPGNATLYVVGDMPKDEMIRGIERAFSGAPAKHLEDIPKDAPVWGSESADPRSLFRRKISCKRPEQLHNFSVPMIGTTGVFTEAAAFDATGEHQKPWHGPIRIFRNELLEGLQLNFYAKAPVRPLRTLEDIRHLVAVRILIGVVQFRIVSRYSSNHAPVQIDHSDSFREGCAVTSVTVNADPRDWRNALACVVQEVRAICDYGITDSEFKRYMVAMLKDVEKGMRENDSVPSEDHLNFIMTSDVFDHVVMHPDQSYEGFKAVEPYVNKEMIHDAAKWMLGFMGFYGQAAAPPPTSVVVCTPTQIFDENTGKWQPFDITEEEIVDLLLGIPDKTKEEALNQVDVPESLLKGHLEKLLANQPVDAATAWRTMSRKRDEATGIVQFILPNGAKVNYACTSNESQGTMRLLVPGGHSADKDGEIGAARVGIRTVSESGAVSDFAREQIELFAVSNLVSVHLDLSAEFSYVDASFSLGDNGLVAVLELLHLLFQEPRWELPAFIRAQQAYKAQNYAMKKSLEQSTLDRLMRMMYAQDPRVSEPLIEDLNKLTLATVRESVLAQLRPQDLEINLVADFEGRNAHKVQNVEGGLSTGKHRGDGDVDDAEIVPQAAIERRLQELDESLWKYLGSIPPSDKTQCDLSRAPQISHGINANAEERQRIAHLEDSDERAVANIGGGAPNRWGKGDKYHTEVMQQKRFSWDSQNSEVKDHPLYPSMCLMAMREVINTRLFTTVRDSLGLSYDCSFELSMFDRLEAGWYTCTVSAHPSRIMEAVNAAKGVLQGAKRRPISDMELSTARRTLTRRHENDIQGNEYWISLLTHLQYDNPKDTTCVRDVELLLQKLKWNDVQNAYQSLLTDPDQLFVSVTTAGPGASYVSGGSAPAAVSTADVQAKELVQVD